MRLGLVSVLGLALVACAGFPRPVEKPTAEVRAVSVGSVSFSGARGEIELDVFNPNGFGVPLQSVDWELSVGTASAVRGSFELGREIPARGMAPVLVGVEIDARDAVAVGRQMAAGARTYRLTGVLRFATRFGPIEVVVESEGQLTDGARLVSGR